MTKLDVPVLFLTFNRLETTISSFNAIRQQQPSRIYLASDGPRPHKHGEDFLVQAVRDYILSHIDWKCEIKTLFREENLGCALAVSSAITWFFENEELGIILEDDCRASSSFFTFCSELLFKYRNDFDVMEISGVNLLGNNESSSHSYYFSRYGGIWGWASWSRAWKLYDFQLKGLNAFIEENRISSIFRDQGQQDYWLDIFSRIENFNTWDYQWLFSVWNSDGVCIVPKVNLVENIGFDSQGTHMTARPHWYNLNRFRVKKLGEVCHPEIKAVDMEADSMIFSRCFNAKSGGLVSRGIRKVLSMFCNHEA